MRGVEDFSEVPVDGGAEWEYSTLVPWKHTSLSFNLQSMDIVSTAQQKAAFKFQVKPSGGILGDEAGLGKTAEVIALIVANPSSNPRPKVSDHKDLFVTPATLIMCPSHLCKQWNTEIAARTQPSLKTIVITDAEDHANYSYKDIMTADVVIVSYHLLLRPDYFRLGYFAGSAPTSTEIAPRSRELKNYYVEMRKRINQNILQQTSPILDLFRWHRIVLDEGHEGLMHPFFGPMIENLESTFRWYVSGTPFPSPESVLQVRQWLALNSNNEHAKRRKSYVPYAIWNVGGRKESSILSDIMLATLSRRHTRESINGQVIIPGIQEQVIELDLSPEERRLYREAAGDTIRQRQICCVPKLNPWRHREIGAASLTNIKQTLIQSTAKEIEAQKVVVAQAQTALNAIPDLGPYNMNFQAFQLMHLQQQLQNVQHQRDVATARLKYETQFLKDLQSTQPRLISMSPFLDETDTCSICLDEFKGAVAMTHCGHILCVDCIKTLLAPRPVAECPQCKVKFKSFAQFNAEASYKRNDPAVLKNVARFGTKMARMITLMRNVWSQRPDAKFVVFSQWHQLLQSVADVLQENDIDTVACVGSVTQRDKAIQDFKNPVGKVNVIMLSLAHSAEGSNLQEASHIIMLDPVDGTKEEVRAIEAQAIGRVDRQGQQRQVAVVRLIYRDTIEETIYKKYKQGQ
jgi:SNF2 family DNA or RNA helicase